VKAGSRSALRLAAAFTLVLVTGCLLWVGAYRWVNPAATQWVPLASVPRPLVFAVVLAEDPAFCEHSGFDFYAIRAAIQLASEGGPVVGASTISQQLAKNLFLWPQRSWLRKAIEVPFTIALETFLDKSRILELYLNIVHWGPGMYGVGERLSKFSPPWKPGDALSAEQAASLAVLLPSPERYSVAMPPEVLNRREMLRQQIDVLPLDAFACTRSTG
jgi:monofunctional glycosyltransferase